jgi:putative membrane-bound dehydrogenase-like protein
LALVLFALTWLRAAEWQPAQVPGPAPATSTDGTAWYRCWVRVADSFFTKHDRNLFEESVGVNIRDLTGAHEVWVNGRRIGAGGSFPPDYRSGQDAVHRHKVPVGTLRKGEWNEVAIRVHVPQGTPAFLGPAPFIMDYFVECVFEGTWEYLADPNYQPGPALSAQPARATFSTFRESQRILGRAEQVHGPALSPSDSATRQQGFEGLRSELVLHEPTIAQPFHFSFDDRGRLWVTQSRQYPYPAGVRMLSRDKYYRAHYDKVPPAPPHHDRGADIISIHESTLTNGVYDLHSVFVDGLNLASAAVQGHGGVWVMHTPYLLFYPDRNRDDVPDGPPEVRLAGFGFEDTHAVANGLAWGPDGWLYGGQGSTVSCRVTRPGLDPTDAPGVHFEGCMVWRYHPETRAFEIFAEGGGNTYGLEFDSVGRLYSGHNGGGTRGWHFIQGGFYLMQGVDPGKFGPPRNPYAFGELPMMSTTNSVARFTHFGAFADGTALPAPLAGLLFALDPLRGEIIASERRPRGSTFDTRDHGVLVRSTDPAFRPVYIANAPDGSLHVADMYEFYIAHGQHYQNQIDPTTGRIHRISGTDSPRETDLNLAARSASQLVSLLGHPNKWHRQTAVRLLGERRESAVLPQLRSLVASNDDPASLHALWALHQSGGLDSPTAIVGLRHPSAPVRLWTVRFLGDSFGIHRNLGLPGVGQVERRIPPPVLEVLLERARIEPDAEVRSQIAATARRLVTPQAFALADAVLRHSEDLDDAFIPLLAWWIFEARIPSETAAVTDFVRNANLWESPVAVRHLFPRIARRLAVEGKRQDLLRVGELLRAAPNPASAKALLTGFEEAYRGRSLTGIPDELLTAMTASGAASRTLRIRQGDTNAIHEALALMADPSAPVDQRLLHTRTFGEVRHTDALPVLLQLATATAAGPTSTKPNPSQLRSAAFASLGAYDDPAIPAQVLAALPTLPTDVRPAAFTLLLHRTAWTRLLLTHLDSARIQASLVPSDFAERLRTHRDPGISRDALRLLPLAAAASTTPADVQQQIAFIEGVLREAPGNPYAGEATYIQRCASCHRLFFKGGNIGPELTRYQRDNLGTLLLSIVHPNAEIREGYQYITVETHDGRSLAGFQVDRDNQVTVLRGLDGQDLTLTAREIKEVQPMGRSLMPEGLLTDLSPQQLRDFFAYLRISQPISSP